MQNEHWGDPNFDQWGPPWMYNMPGGGCGGCGEFPPYDPSQDNSMSWGGDGGHMGGMDPMHMPPMMFNPGGPWDQGGACQGWGSAPSGKSWAKGQGKGGGGGGGGGGGFQEPRGKRQHQQHGYYSEEEAQKSFADIYDLDPAAFQDEAAVKEALTKMGFEPFKVARKGGRGSDFGITWKEPWMAKAAEYAFDRTPKSEDMFLWGKFQMPISCRAITSPER